MIGTTNPEPRRTAPPGHPARPGFLEISPGLAAVLLVAAALRAVYFVLYARGGVYLNGLILDAEVYDRWAQAIASGQWVGTEAFYRPPLYPYLLGLLFRLAGHSLPLVYLGQAFLGVAGIFLVHRVGEALFGRRAALLAAAGMALYAPLPFLETKVLATTLGVTLGLTALLALVRAGEAAGRRPAARRFAAGSIIGLAAQCLPAMVLLAPGYAAAWLRRDGLRPALPLLAGTLLLLLPSLAHNLYVAGDPMLLSGQGGITFYQGNHAGAPGLYRPVPGVSGDPHAQAGEERALAERETGGAPLRRSEVSAHFFARGLAFIARAPGEWLLLEGRKLLYLLGDYEASTEYSLYVERGYIPFLRVFFLPYAAIAGLGLGGAILLRREPPGAAGTALRIYTLVAAAVPLVFYVSSRYRLPLVPALLLYGGALTDRLLREWRASGAPSPAAARAGALALVVALVSYLPLGRPQASVEGNVWYNIANLLADANSHEEALALYDRALTEWPGNAFAHINRGNSLDRLGREEEALASYRRAEEVEPGFWTAYRAQGIILRRRGRYEEELEAYRRAGAAGAGGGAEARHLTGLALERLGRTEEAIAAYEEALRIEPGHPAARRAIERLRP